MQCGVVFRKLDIHSSRTIEFYVLSQIAYIGECQYGIRARYGDAITSVTISNSTNTCTDHLDYSSNYRFAVLNISNNT